MDGTRKNAHCKVLRAECRQLATMASLGGTGYPKQALQLLSLLFLITLLAFAHRSAAAELSGGGELEPLTKLRPGHFVWQPELAPDGPVSVVVSIPEQRAQVFRAGVLIATTTVSTGKRGHRTPTGVFPILQKQVMHRSNLYDDAPMPFMQRLTWTGVAMHAGKIPGYPTSHGCVRLPKNFSKLLSGITRTGDSVVIDDAPLSIAVEAHRDLIAPVTSDPAQVAASEPALATVSLAGNPGGLTNPALVAAPSVP